MKKVIYTASLLAFFAVTAQAQTETKQEPKKDNQASVKSTTQPKKEEKAPAPAASEQAKPGTRMAINEKGVPASKATTGSKDKKDEKPASPGQPTTEKH